MRARYKAPAGTGVIEFGDDATLKSIFSDIREKTGIQDFSIKYGPPTAMKTLDASSQDESAKSLGLHGETLTVVPEKARSISPVSAPVPAPVPANPPAQSQASQPPRKHDEGPEEVNVPWAEREGTLLLRVMPSDNSCLFTAFGGALPSQIPAQRLRSMMADYISQHSDVYTEAVLGNSPSQYCRSIQDPDRWGGGIELSILSSIFNIQICTYDVQAQNLMNFGEDKQDRCILVYSGIHYDRVAFTYTDYPHTSPTLPPEMDRTLWPTTDNEVLDKTQELVRKLNNAHYYTDTEGLILKCDVPGCEWIGSGQAEGSKHASETGHLELSEIKDTEGDNVLRSCNEPGCDFMGQGDGPMRQHSADTGHQGFSVIPDW